MNSDDFRKPFLAEPLFFATLAYTPPKNNADLILFFHGNNRAAKILDGLQTISSIVINEDYKYHSKYTGYREVLSVLLVVYLLHICGCGLFSGTGGCER